MTRRTAFQLAGAAAALPRLSAQPAPLKGRLKQSAARWCYSKMSLDDLARNAARIGLQGVDLIDYKDVRLVGEFIAERGKILPRRISGNCAKHQRQLATAIKRARVMLLVR